MYESISFNSQKKQWLLLSGVCQLLFKKHTAVQIVLFVYCDLGTEEMRNLNFSVSSSFKKHARELEYILIYSGAPAAQRAAKWSPILIEERKGNP